MRNFVRIAGLFFSPAIVFAQVPPPAQQPAASPTSSNLVAVTRYRHVCVREKWTRPLMGALSQWLCTGKHFSAPSRLPARIAEQMVSL